MRKVSARLEEILDDGTFTAELTVDAFYGAERTMRDLSVAPSWKLAWKRGDRIPGSGKVLVQYDSVRGESLTPRDFTDRLAPFGQQLAPKITIRAGDVEETVQVGRWRIADVPSARDETLSTPAQVLTVGSFVEIDLRDPLEAVLAAGFTRLEQPPAAATAWTELQRLTGMKLSRSLPDIPVPSTITYDLSDGGRLDACRSIAEALGGTLYALSDGTLTVLPDAMGTPVARYKVGDRSTMLRVEHGMSSQGVYNQIVGVFENDERETIVKVAQETDGPLSVSGEFGVRTKYVSSRMVKTPAAAEQFVQRELAQSLQARSFRIPVEARLDPRREVGDTVEVERASETFTGMVAEVEFRANGTMGMQVDVAARVPERNL